MAGMRQFWPMQTKINGRGQFGIRVPAIRAGEYNGETRTRRGVPGVLYPGNLRPQGPRACPALRAGIRADLCRADVEQGQILILFRGRATALPLFLQVRKVLLGVVRSLHAPIISCGKGIAFPLRSGLGADHLSARKSRRVRVLWHAARNNTVTGDIYVEVYTGHCHRRYSGDLGLCPQSTRARANARSSPHCHGTRCHQGKILNPARV